MSRLPTDIRNSVPQINPSWLPKAEPNTPYPRMMARMVDGKHVAYKHPNGQPVIVQNEREEEAFKNGLADVKPPAPKAVEVSANAEPTPTVDPLANKIPYVDSKPIEEKRGPGRPRTVTLDP